MRRAIFLMLIILFAFTAFAVAKEEATDAGTAANAPVQKISEATATADTPANVPAQKTSEATSTDTPAKAPIPKVVEIDRNHDGVPDRFEYYNPDGSVDRIETDTNFDGKIDEWVYYKNGVVVRAEKDTTGSGKPDTWMKY